MNPTEKPSRKKLATPYIASFIGNLVSAIGINAFFIPHHLLSSGIGGIAIMLYFTTGIPVGAAVFILNIPIMIACYKYMGRKYTFISLMGTVIFSVLVDVTSFMTTWTIIKDPIISSVAGGLMSGLGFGLLYRYNVNSGGLDVVGAIVKKYYSLEMGNVVMGINTIILVAAAYLFSLELAVLTFVGTYIGTFITNKVVIGLKQRKSVIIISNRAEPIAHILMRYVGHGATYLHGQGAYTMQDKQVIYAIIKLTEVAKVKELVNKLDPMAFMIISDASEVVGRGFTAPPVKYHSYPGDALSMPHTKKNIPPEY
ncbi:YitT family protein [Megasphaera cerevisiae]|uniref:YitT family protein n=1 Tax=Megasphaera cerevisiae TaxID=39029 RepID=UPI000943B96E|nr:YitT family protein [Megasphaera cerevisiae]OKY52746.1 membrane protein [Megasphaera cerevisiae]